MTARGASRDDDDGRVGTVLAAVFAHPGDRLLHVDQRIGEPRRRKQAVVRADAHPALAGEPVEQGTCSESLAAEAEGSSVQVLRRPPRSTELIAGGFTVDGDPTSCGNFPRWNSAVQRVRESSTGEDVLVIRARVASVVERQPDGLDLRRIRVLARTRGCPDRTRRWGAISADGWSYLWKGRLRHWLAHLRSRII